MICRMAVDFFLVITPCCCTAWGNCARAAETRFCTSTWAQLRSVPTLTVTVSEHAAGNCDTKRTTCGRTSTARQHERQHTQDESERCHHNRTKTDLRGMNYRISNVLACGATFPRHLYN